jgi:hypothetical protein
MPLLLLALGMCDRFSSPTRFTRVSSPPKLKKISHALDLKMSMEIDTIRERGDVEVTWARLQKHLQAMLPAEVHSLVLNDLTSCNKTHAFSIDGFELFVSRDKKWCSYSKLETSFKITSSDQIGTNYFLRFFLLFEHVRFFLLRFACKNPFRLMSTGATRDAKCLSIILGDESATFIILSNIEIGPITRTSLNGYPAPIR